MGNGLEGLAPPRMRASFAAHFVAMFGLSHLAPINGAAFLLLARRAVGAAAASDHRLGVARLSDRVGLGEVRGGRRARGNDAMTYRRTPASPSQSGRST